MNPVEPILAGAYSGYRQRIRKGDPELPRKYYEPRKPLSRKRTPPQGESNDPKKFEEWLRKQRSAESSDSTKKAE